MEKNYYITTPIYYVNDKPHIGHAYTSIACDVLARFKRLEGYNVKFLTGTDEHGQKVEKAAILQNRTPIEFADEISENFKSLTDLLNLSNDDFIRTTEKRHKVASENIWKKLIENNLVESKSEARRILKNNGIKKQNVFQINKKKLQSCICSINNKL